MSKPKMRNIGVNKCKTPKPDICRTESGKFPPGCSGNPKGRPKDSKDKRTEDRKMLQPNKAALINKLVTTALHGKPPEDMQALKLCIDRLVAPLRSVSQPVSISIAPGSLTQGAQSVIDACTRGDLTTDDAKSLIELLMSKSKLHEVESLESRILALEKDRGED